MVPPQARGARAGDSGNRGLKAASTGGATGNGDAERRLRLREMRTRQTEGEDLRRRWFTCPHADLYVWEDGEGVNAFEFCYDKPHDEHGVRWERGRGTTHTRIDDGETGPLQNRAPIAVPNGVLDPAQVALRFESVGASIEPRLFRLVLRVLHGMACCKSD